jgi:alpha-methylacyl-CoA racemase
MSGPLTGLRIIEMAGIGPAPFACMMLADHGAEVIRVCRPGCARVGVSPGDNPRKDVLLRSRRTIEVDIKSPEGAALVKDLIASAAGVVEGFRPGVMERLGLGPEELLECNPSLVFGRMTGWGQYGPYAQTAGHDINYIALAGALHGLGRAGDKPTPPANLLGDMGGGGMMLAFGMVSALYHARATGEGQVIDCAIVDGVAVLMNMQWGLRAQGAWHDERGVNVVDTGAHFYDTYLTADGKYLSVGSIEPRFYSILRERLGLDDDPDFDSQMDPLCWNELRAKLAALFMTRTRAQWCMLLEFTDACFAPVLSMAEAMEHPHNRERGVFLDVEGVIQAAPAPRYSRTNTRTPTLYAGVTDPRQILSDIGYDEDDIQGLLDRQVIA